MSFERIVALRGIDALDGNMGDMTIRTDAATAERLRRVAEAAGLSLGQISAHAMRLPVPAAVRPFGNG